MIKKATDPESREYWRFVERVAAEGPAPIRCDICGITPTTTIVIYARGKARLCEQHYDRKATSVEPQPDVDAVDPHAEANTDGLRA